MNKVIFGLLINLILYMLILFLTFYIQDWKWLIVLFLGTILVFFMSYHLDERFWRNKL